MDICALPSVDRQLLARKVGNDLAKRHGKKEYYAIQEVKAAARRHRFPDTWDCWALALYSSRSDFDAHHIETGEVCDYSSMHSTMISAVSSDNSLPDVIHQVTAATEGSWFSNLMDHLGTIEIHRPDIGLSDLGLLDIDT